jgi:DNA topoisomerase-2
VSELPLGVWVQIFKEKLDIKSTIKNLLYGFGSDGRIKKFKNANEIIDEFYGVRFTLYTKRRLYLLIKYGRTMRILENKLRYLWEVIEITNKNTEITKQFS